MLAAVFLDSASLPTKMGERSRGARRGAEFGSYCPAPICLRPVCPLGEHVTLRSTFYARDASPTPPTAPFASLREFLVSRLFSDERGAPYTADLGFCEAKRVYQKTVSFRHGRRLRACGETESRAG